MPIATFKDRLSEFIAQAQAGEEVIVTKHGRPTVKLVPVEEDHRARYHAALEGWFALGDEVRAAGAEVDGATVRRWLDEDRRYS